MRQVPNLSLLSYVQGSNLDKQKFVDNLFTGIKDYGFIVLTDHTVDEKAMHKGYELLNEFFSLPENIKMKYHKEGGGGQRGYTPFGQEHAKNNPHPDLKEFWHVGRSFPANSMSKFSNIYPENVWPSEIKEFKSVFTLLYESLDKTSELLLDALGTALDVPQSYFREMIKDGNSILRPIHYPPIPEKGFENSVRSAAHEDINLITILMGATDSGLQLLDRDGKWLDVNSKMGQLVVDSGDVLSRICNDVIPSTTHRVINTPEGKERSRYSMPFFVHPNTDVQMTCIPSCVGSGKKYEDIPYAKFFEQRLKDIGLY